MPEMQIFEPVVIEVEAPAIPILPTITTPPLGIGLPPPITISYTCPFSTYCGTDDPCDYTKTTPTLSIPGIPSFSFPPLFNFPVFGFRIEVPPPLFVNCPALPKEEYQANQDAIGQDTKKETPTTPTANDKGESTSLYENKKWVKGIIYI